MFFKILQPSRGEERKSRYQTETNRDTMEIFVSLIFSENITRRKKFLKQKMCTLMRCTTFI